MVNIAGKDTNGCKCSQAAIDLIVAEEIGSEAEYTRLYQHFSWPGGASGPTVGVGYDCGYVTSAQIRVDWTGIISDQMVLALVAAAGLKGEAGRAFVGRHRETVTITYDQAMRQFMERELPKWETRVSQVLPNANLLDGDCFGALTSIAYNRGVGGFISSDERFREMHAIRDYMSEKRFDLIPDQILAMRRLWAEGGDLWNRRTHEAALFRKGLARAGVSQAMPAPQPTPPAIPVPPKAAPASWLDTILSFLKATFGRK